MHATLTAMLALLAGCDRLFGLVDVEAGDGSGDAGGSRDATAGGGPSYVDGVAAQSGCAGSCGTTFSFSYELTAGSARLLVVAIAVGGSNRDWITSVTYNAAALKSLGRSLATSPRVNVELWYMKEGDAADGLGSITNAPHDLVIYPSTAIATNAITMLFEGVDQQSPLASFVRAEGNAATSTLEVTSDTSTSIIIDAITCWTSGTLAVSTGPPPLQVERGHVVNTGSDPFSLAASTRIWNGNPTSITYGVTGSSDWGHIAAEIR